MKLSAPPPPPPEPDQPETPGADTPATPEAPPAVVPSPPAKTVAWPAWFAGVDALLAALAVLLAFLVASFAARNSDLWLHLGAGRMLTTGEYKLGSDPFSYSAADRPWVNHSWLWDLGAYLLYTGSGTLLVALKAIVVAAAFALLIAIRRPNQSLWPWAAVAAVAALAAAPRMTLHPFVGSVLLLAVTLFLLFRVPHKPGSWRFPIAIGVVFWFWANLDTWFILGPFTLALLLVGELIQKNVLKRTDEPSPDDTLGAIPDIPTLAKALGIGVLACMLNPNHIRVWELPFELVGSAAAKADPQLARGLLLAPIDRIYSDRADMGYNLNGLAYWVLLIGGGVAIGFGFGRLRIAHLALWIGFALLSLSSVFAIPFFAVVAVPLVASQLNTVSAGIRLDAKATRRTRLLLAGSALGRVVCVIGAAALCVAAWPGWLHPAVNNPADVRRVVWEVDPDAGLVQAAGQFEKWRAAGTLPPASKGILAAIELANYCAWYAPSEKVFIDGRYNHHRPELEDFVAFRAALGVIQKPEETPSPRAAGDILKRHGASYTALYDRFRQRAGLEAINRLWHSWETWTTWYLDGRATVFGWRESPAAPDPTFNRLRLDAVVQAFGPDVPRVPAPVVEPPPPPRDWVDDFTRPVRPASPAADEALGWLDYKQSVAYRQVQNQQVGLLLLRNAPGIAAPPLGVVHHQVWNEMAARAGANMPAPHPADGSFQAIAILAVRAARRAIAANPNHPDGYFALARVLADRDLPISESDRMIGQVTAFRQCLVRMPPPDQFKPRTFTASPTAVAQELARLYLGTPLPNGQPAGMPVNLFPFRELAGDMLVQSGNQIGRIPVMARGNLPPNAREIGGPYLLPLDLARQALVLANDYAAVEFAQLNLPEERKKEAIDALKNEEKGVKDLLARANDQYKQRAERTTKVAERYALARQFGLIGEALAILQGADLNKEFGPAASDIALQKIALEACVGRLEDALGDIDGLTKATDALAQQPDINPQVVAALRRLVRFTDYQLLVLAGDFGAAGKEYESLEGGQVGLEQVKPFLEKFDTRPFTALGPAWPILPMLGSDSPLGVIANYWGGVLQHQQFAILQNEIAGRLQADAEFFFRRGFLSLMEGDIPAAKERFKQSFRQPPTGWGLPNFVNASAAMYLRLIEDAEKRAAR